MICSAMSICNKRERRLEGLAKNKQEDSRVRGGWEGGRRGGKQEPGHWGSVDFTKFCQL